MINIGHANLQEDWRIFPYIEHIIAQICTDKQEYDKYQNAINLIKQDIETNNLDTLKYGLVEPSEALICIPSYFGILQTLTSPQNCIIVDCGCGVGIQQIVFNKCKKYIGIDINNVFISISDNSTFIHGKIEDILPTIQEQYIMEFKNTSKYDIIGISHWCCSYFDCLSVFKDTFTKLITI